MQTMFHIHTQVIKSQACPCRQAN